MIWLLGFLPLAAIMGYLLHAFAKQADELEDDAAHLYQNRQPEPYGSKWLNILTGRDDG